MVSSFHRAVLEAEIELQDGDAETSASLANTAGEGMRASGLAHDLRPLISDADLVEGWARLRSGSAIAARPLLEQALATRAELYPPDSPKIAQALLALAECDLAQEGRAEAVRRVERAAAIVARHRSLALRYTEPLERVRARLAGK
jgi:serine/threonine-protein kinase